MKTNLFIVFSSTDDDEINHIVETIQKRCSDVKHIEHIGINSVIEIN